MRTSIPRNGAAIHNTAHGLQKHSLENAVGNVAKDSLQRDWPEFKQAGRKNPISRLRPRQDKHQSETQMTIQKYLTASGGELQAPDTVISIGVLECGGEQ